MFVNVHYDELLREFAVRGRLLCDLCQTRRLVDTWVLARADFTEGELTDEDEFTWLVVDVVGNTELFNLWISHLDWCLVQLRIIQ